MSIAKSMFMGTSRFVAKLKARSISRPGLQLFERLAD